uniref:Uncharacterized protein n=1 Tax=Periophthalmus magnuspinnatus TaxID=409849 RepID=A0A3B4AH73_9GOBI
GLEMAWVQRPPEKVTNGEAFNVTYTVTASDSFYQYAVRNKIFQFCKEILSGPRLPCELEQRKDELLCLPRQHPLLPPRSQIGQMHAALESKVLVVPAQCGDDLCEQEENCLNCPADCGICPMSIAIKLAIGLPVALFCSGFI